MAVDTRRMRSRASTGNSRREVGRGLAAAVEDALAGWWCRCAVVEGVDVVGVLLAVLRLVRCDEGVTPRR